VWLRESRRITKAAEYDTPVRTGHSLLWIPRTACKRSSNRLRIEAGAVSREETWETTISVELLKRSSMSSCATSPLPREQLTLVHLLDL